MRCASEKLAPNSVHVLVCDTWEALLNINRDQKSCSMVIFRVIEDAAAADPSEHVLREAGRREEAPVHPASAPN